MLKYIGRKFRQELPYNFLFKNVKRLFNDSGNRMTNAIVFKNEDFLAEPAQKYYDLLDQHFKMKIPFIDENYYKELLKTSSQIAHNSELESWDILDRYTILNMENIDREFLTQILEQFAKVKFSKYEIWYLSEKFIIKNIKDFTNQQLATLIVSFGSNDKGSNHLFNNFAKEVLDRKIRNFNQNEFESIYIGFKYNKIKDKLLWAILERTKIELYPNLQFEY